MSKLRLKFVKEGQAGYISHLDLMRTFQRVFPRTGLEISHSNGFHPHPILSIVLPLPVGQSSGCELLDLTVEQDSDGSGIVEKLNPGFPAGLRALECYPAERPVRDLAFIQAELELLYDGGVPENCGAALEALFRRESIVIQKKTKRREMADVDIRPLIHSLAFEPEEKRVLVRAVVAAQNPGLNPALLGTAAAKELPELAPDFVRVRRTAFLDREGKLFR